MKRTLLFPLTLAFCAAAALLRLWQVTGGFEPDTGLAIPGHPAAILLAAAVIAAALFLLWFTRPLAGEAVQQADLPPLRGPQTLPAVLLAVAGLLVLGQLALQLPALLQSALAAEKSPLLNLLMALYMPLLTGFSLLFGGIFLLRFAWKKLDAVPAPASSGPVLGGLTAVLPAFSCCMLLVSIYQSHANDPTVQGYFWTELGLFFAMLAWYGLTALWYAPGKRRILVLLCLFAAVMQCAALFSPQSLFKPEILLVLLGNLIWFLTQGSQLLGLAWKPAAQG